MYDSVDFGWKTPQEFEGIIKTFEQIMRSPWEPVGDSNILDLHSQSF